MDQYRADMQKYFPNLALDTTNLYGYQKPPYLWKRCNGPDAS
jgi:hypothetical protein